MLIHLTAQSLILAILIDAIFGDPKKLYEIIPHPVVLMGKLISYFDRLLNKENHSNITRLIFGGSFTIISIFAICSLSTLITLYFKDYKYFWLVEALIIASLLSQKSLYIHVNEVLKSLKNNNLEEAKLALSKIVSRDVSHMDESDIIRSSVESLSENYSDGIVAPLFFALLFGLPGIITYKYINTLDSMIGYKNDKYFYFGKLAARIDDVANFIPARLSIIPIILGGLFVNPKKVLSSFRIIIKDAKKHKSINAGYPECAYAGILGIKLAGPRYYDGIKNKDPFIGEGDEILNKNHLNTSLKLFIVSLIIGAITVFFVLLPYLKQSLI